MPYEIETRDGIVLSNIPDEVKPDDPRLQQMVAQERIGRRQRSPEFKQKLAANLEEDRARYDPTVGMGAGEKVLANLGAGFSTLGQGIKDVFGKVKDEDIQEKRRIDQHLAQQTDLGIGPDWAPTAGSALQVAGEALPTLAVPGGLIARAGGRVLPRALRGAVSGPVGSAAAAGGVAGALMPTTEDESRLFNVGLGGVAGAALPAALALKRGASKVLGGSQARVAAGEKMGVTADSALPADPAALAIRGAENVPLSTAATYARRAGEEAAQGAVDPQHLASLELASRARGAANPEWAGLDRATREAVWENVQAGTQRAGTEDAARAARRAGWTEESQRAMDAIRPRNWQRERMALRAKLDKLMRTPQGQGQMRGVYSEIARQMDAMGEKFGPEFLAEIRGTMSGKIKGSPTDPFVSAPRTDPAFMALRDELDAILNRSSGGRWERVTNRYREESVPVSQAKAESAVRGRFESPEGTFRVNAPEGTPDVTYARLRDTIAGLEQKNKFGAPTFAPDSGRVLKGTLQALEQKNISQAAKITQTGGGGSMTTPLAKTIGRMSMGDVSTALEQAWSLATNLGDKAALRELDKALIDPQRYYQIVQETIRRKQPLSPAMQLVVRSLQQSAATGGARAAQQPEDSYAP